ncbi:uncharacterized protein LOC126375410 [Pectinophora gossypiella]|uniref:uncharacterized protein LOC126375410 n=1 Tax=Pectinophora gossypiella TaxID=13191 RepID=UPI00214E0E76|nr:uncharacterized protein LOC126375410 [Pectinophora gossypiella]
MVKLPTPEEQAARPVGERGSTRPVPMRTRNHHNWGARFGRRRADPSLRAEPTTLHQIEEQVNRTVQLMERHGQRSDNNYPLAMDLLRLQYNLNFLIPCDKPECADNHAHDELSAPERLKFAVIAAASLFIDKADSSPQNIDVQNLLQSLQQQLQLEQQQVRQKVQQNRVEEEERDEDNDDNEGRFGSLKKQDVERLLGLADTQQPSRPKDRFTNRNDRLSILDIKKYLQQKQAAEKQSQQVRLSINDLLGLNDDKDALESSSSEENTRNDENPNGFSKVYVVLNTEAIKRSKNKDKLNSLLSSLLAAPAQSSGDRKKPPSYKGFVLNNKLNLNSLGRRLNRDSSEIYAKDMVEKERPMRPRESRSRDRGRERGGGGGSGGRTAIPYIRHRGDIYERDE